MKNQNDANGKLISIFNDTFHKKQSKAEPIGYILEQIKTNKEIESKINIIRNETDKSKRNILKEKLPCFTLSGLFKEKNDSGLLQHSNLICMDLDDVEDVKYCKTELIKDPYTFACFLSASGKGLAVIVKIDGTKHRESFDGLAEYYYNLYSLIVDPACKNLSRLRFMSFDPELYHNPDSKIFKKYISKQKKATPKYFNHIPVKGFFEKLVFSINTDICQSYNVWFKVGCSIASQFGESGLQYFRQLSQFRESSKPNFEKLIDKQYEYCCGYTKYFTIGTFYYYAKQAGYNIANKEDDAIAKKAYFARVGGKNPEQAIDELKKYYNSKPENELRDIISAVFDNKNYKPIIKAEDDEELSLFENVIEWLLINYNLKRNEITKFIEDNGMELEEKHFNSIFIAAKKVFTELTYDNFFRIINSTHIKDYNPIKEYLESLKWDGIDRIQKLVESIGTDTGTLQWRCNVFTNWLVGIVESVYGGKSVLFLLLSGAQNTGKSEFFRLLLPRQLKRYFAESQLDEGKDDKLLMTQKLIILDDEYSGKSKQDSKKMKLMLSANIFSLRAPYGSKNADYRRIANLCGTTNEDEVLNDPTGNRRFIVFEVNRTNDFDKYNDVDKEQLFAQIYSLYCSGGSSKLSEENKKLMDEYTFDKHYEAPIEEEMLIKFFKSTNNEEGEFLMSTEIKDYIEKNSEQKLFRNRLSAALKKLKFKRVMHPIKKRYGFWVEKIQTDGYTDNRFGGF